MEIFKLFNIIINKQIILLFTVECLILQQF